MKGQVNAQAGAPKPEKLTWAQLDTLARALAIDLMQEPEIASEVMLLMDEISQHPFDHSHVETIANLVNAHLFAVTGESEAARARFVATERQKLTATEGGTR